MEIRMLGLQELSLALDLVWEVFEQDVAPSYREEGIEKFREYICYEDMSRRFQTRELYFFGAFEGEKLLGVIAVSRTGLSVCSLCERISREKASEKCCIKRYVNSAHRGLQ